MRAVALKGKREFEVKEIEEPVKDTENVVIKVLKAGICGSDLHYFEMGEPKGLIMGHEFCGEVINPGNRSDLKVGDRVTALPISPCLECSACLSGNPQYCKSTWTQAVGLSLDNPGALGEKIKVRSDMVLKVPDNVSDEEAAMVEPTAVALHGIHLADVKVGSKVLVIGGGIIGLLSAMFAKKEGASFVAVSETIKEVMADTKGGFDIVIECCGNDSAVTSSLVTVRPGGIVVLVGVATGPISIPTVIAVMNELTVKGAIAYTKEEFATCLDLISNKQIDVMPFVDDIVSYEEVENAYIRLTSGNDGAVKILVDPSK